MAKKKAKKKVQDLIKVKEITVSLSGVIPTASFENLRPSFSMTVEPRRKLPPNKVFDHIEGILHNRFQLIENRAKVDLIERQYSFLRFRGKNGRKYPSVTSILYWNALWKIPQDELRQYAARGKIVDVLLQNYFETGKWTNPSKLPELKEEVSIILGGSLGLTWENCSYKKFLSRYKKKTNIKKIKPIIFNDEHLYSGEIDFVGEYNGQRAIIDIKTGTFDMRQLAAYAVCEKGIEVLVIFPVGPTDNKCGYMRPVICDTINDKFREFLRARGKFKERFGI